MVIVANMQIYTFLHQLMWVVLKDNCVNFITFCILVALVWMLITIMNSRLYIYTNLLFMVPKIFSNTHRVMLNLSRCVAKIAI